VLWFANLASTILPCIARYRFVSRSWFAIWFANSVAAHVVLRGVGGAPVLSRLGNIVAGLIAGWFVQVLETDIFGRQPQYR
jgi:ABC-type thiamin/hydroxymethylpyrimidine transport system permease subunit